MDGGLFGETTLAHDRFERLLERGGGQGRGPVPGRDQPGAGPPELPVLSSQLPGPVGQWYRAVFAPLALADQDQHTLGIDVRDLQWGPLPKAKPTSVDQPPAQPGCRVLDQGKEIPHVPRTEHDRQFLDIPGAHTVEDGPRSLERQLVEEPDPVEVDAEGALGDVLLIEQGEEILAQLL